MVACGHITRITQPPLIAQLPNLTNPAHPSRPQALQRNNTLVTLGLSNNEIGAAGCVALTKAMEKHNRSLKTIELLPGNHVSPKQAKALAKAVKRHSKCVQHGLGASHRAGAALSVAMCCRAIHSALLTPTAPLAPCRFSIKSLLGISKDKDKDKEREREGKEK